MAAAKMWVLAVGAALTLGAGPAALSRGAGVVDTTGAVSTIEISAGYLVPSSIDGHPARLKVGSYGLDRLVLNLDFVKKNGLKSAPLFGSATLSLAGHNEFKGKNRPLSYQVAGVAQKGRAAWFFGAPPSEGDGRIGPWAMPQARVSFALNPPALGEVSHVFPLFGDANTSSVTGYEEAAFAMAVAFDVDADSAYPLASAAIGAALARVYGGALSGESWQVPVVMGIKRPVRLLTLERPFIIGPFSFTKVAVRVRDRADRAGFGSEIRDADVVQDPDEIIVSARGKKGPAPAMSFVIPRGAMNDCSRLTFDKAAARITLNCRLAWQNKDIKREI
ncbi:MAG: hypothetical protein WC803_06340 [Sphingomonas sp.]|jgi:hypothetical protein